MSGLSPLSPTNTMAAGVAHLHLDVPCVDGGNDQHEKDLDALIGVIKDHKTHNPVERNLNFVRKLGEIVTIHGRRAVMHFDTPHYTLRVASANDGLIESIDQINTVTLPVFVTESATPKGLIDTLMSVEYCNMPKVVALLAAAYVEVTVDLSKEVLPAPLKEKINADRAGKRPCNTVQDWICEDAVKGEYLCETPANALRTIPLLARSVACVALIPLAEAGKGEWNPHLTGERLTIAPPDDKVITQIATYTEDEERKKAYGGISTCWIGSEQVWPMQTDAIAKRNWSVVAVDPSKEQEQTVQAIKRAALHCAIVKVRPVGKEAVFKESQEHHAELERKRKVAEEEQRKQRRQVSVGSAVAAPFSFGNLSDTNFGLVSKGASSSAQPRMRIGKIKAGSKTHQKYGVLKAIGPHSLEDSSAILFQVRAIPVGYQDVLLDPADSQDVMREKMDCYIKKIVSMTRELLEIGQEESAAISIQN